MAGKRNVEEQVAALDALREQATEARVEPLRKALKQKNNFVAAKAADLVREFELHALIPELLESFDRFFENPEKSDPQCWGKNAISRALAAFEHQDSTVFLRGLKHVQLEPVWGGRSDTAGTLRGTCVLALVQCHELAEVDLLARLVELFDDKDKAVRVEVARAIEQVGSSSAALLLRLRAVLGKDEPEVLGACHSGVLSIEGVRAIAWVCRFLETADDAATEAALAIAGTHFPRAFEVLRESLERTSDPWFRSVLLSAIALTRQDAAVDFLFDLVRKESLDAEAAIESVMRSMPSNEVVKELEELVVGNQRLARVLAANRK